MVCLPIIPQARNEYDTVAKLRVKYNKRVFLLKIAAQRILINLSEIIF